MTILSYLLVLFVGYLIGRHHRWLRRDTEIAALKLRLFGHEEALQYLLDSVDEHGDSTERMVHNVCTTALKEEE